MEVQANASSSQIHTNKFMEAAKYMNISGTVEHLVIDQGFSIYSIYPNNYHIDNDNNPYNSYQQTNVPFYNSVYIGPYPPQSLPVYNDPQRMYNTTGLYENNYQLNQIQYPQQQLQPQYQPLVYQSQAYPILPPPSPLTQSCYIPNCNYSQNISQFYLPSSSDSCFIPSLPPPPPMAAAAATTTTTTTSELPKRLELPSVPPKVIYYSKDETKKSEEHHHHTHKSKDKKKKSNKIVIIDDKKSEKIEIVKDENIKEVAKEKEKKKEKELNKNDKSAYIVQVNGINENTSESFLNDVFGIVGNLLSCKIINENNNNSRYALVKYSNEKSAKKAIEKLNNAKIKGSKISVNWYIEILKNQIILENLPSNIEEERLINICSIIGEIESIEIEHPCNANERSRCSINFVDENSIETAKEIFEDSIIDGLETKLIVDRYIYVKENSKKK